MSNSVSIFPRDRRFRSNFMPSLVPRLCTSFQGKNEMIDGGSNKFNPRDCMTPSILDFARLSKKLALGKIGSFHKLRQRDTLPDLESNGGRKTPSGNPLNRSICVSRPKVLFSPSYFIFDPFSSIILTEFVPQIRNQHASQKAKQERKRVLTELSSK